MKNKPLLHLACETEEMFSILKNGLGQAGDIIECGTGFIFKRGFSAVSEFKNFFPDKEIVADVKMTPLVVLHYGKTVLDQGADSVIITGTNLKREMQPTMELAKEKNKKFYVLLEIEKDEEPNENLLKMYKEVGVEYIIYHSIKTNEPYWAEDDISNIKKISDYGFNVSVTEKINTKSILLFKDVPIYSFVLGSSIFKAEDPIAQLNEYKKIIDTF